MNISREQYGTSLQMGSTFSEHCIFRMINKRVHMYFTLVWITIVQGKNFQYEISV